MAADELICGLHAVSAALEHDPASILELWADSQRNDQRLLQLLALAERQGVMVQPAPRKQLEKLARGVRHQGVVARCRTRGAAQDEAALRALVLESVTPPFLLVLDGVQDPHNLGACLRSADAAGVQAVITPRDRAVGLTPVVRKVASGAAEALPFIQVTNLSRTLNWLKEQGVWLVGAAGEADGELYATDLRGPLAIVMGAEGKGLRRLTREACDRLVSIPMAGTVESLNVSVATGIMLFEARRQRAAG